AIFAVRGGREHRHHLCRLRRHALPESAPPFGRRCRPQLRRRGGAGGGAGAGVPQEAVTGARPGYAVGMTVVEFREQYRNTEIGAHYSGWGHFAFTSTLSLAAIVWAASGVHSPSALEWLTVPLTFLFANFGEYSGHKGTMHVPRRGLG